MWQGVYPSSSFFPCRIPDSIGRDIEKRCQSIYPLKDVYVRKVKILKKPKHDSKYKCACVHLCTRDLGRRRASVNGCSGLKKTV